MRSLPSLLLVVALLMLFALVGCGGGKSDNSGPQQYQATPLTAQITLPTSTAVGPVENLKVWTSAGENRPSASGAAKVVVFNGGPQYTDVRNAQGKMVLSGFVGTDQTALNAETTAELLAFFHTGGSTQIEDGVLAYLQGIRGLTGFSDVVAAINAQIAAQGYIDVTQGDLKTVLTSIASNLSGRGRGTIATPTSDSGISLDTIVDGELKITNVYLRRLVGFLQRTGYTDSSGTFHEELGEAKQIDIEAPKRFSGVVGTIGDLARGELAYSPVTTAALPIPLDPASAESTSYELRVGGLGYGNQYPNLFKGTELQTYRTLVIKSILLDAIFPTILKIILPIGDNVMDDVFAFSGGNAVFTEMLNSILITAPSVYDLAVAGRNQDAIVLAYETLVGSSATFTIFTQYILDLAVHLGTESFFNGAGSFSEKLSSRMGLLSIVDIIGNSADMILFLRDVAKSEQTSKFEIITTGGKVTLSPAKPKLLVKENTLITATIQNKNSNAVYRYEWSVNEGYTLTNESGTTASAPGGVLVSNSDIATLFGDTEEPGKALVKCKITRIDGEPDNPIDQPKVEVQFVAKPTITPNPAQVKTTDSLTLTGKFTGEGNVFWKFSLPSTEYGTINRTNIGDNPEVIFTSKSKIGTVTLTGECYLDAAGTQLLHTVTVPISVSNESIGKILDLHYETTYGKNTFNSYWYGFVFAFVDIEPVPGAVKYEVYIDGQLYYSWNAGDVPGNHSPSDNWYRYLVASNRVVTEYFLVEGTGSGHIGDWAGSSGYSSEENALENIAWNTNIIHNQLDGKIISLKVYF